MIRFTENAVGNDVISSILIPVAVFENRTPLFFRSSVTDLRQFSAPLECAIGNCLDANRDSNRLQATTTTENIGVNLAHLVRNHDLFQIVTVRKHTALKGSKAFR